MKKELYATSTIAFSIYNLIAVQRGVGKREELLKKLKTIQHPEIEKEHFDSAVSELLNRKYIVDRDGILMLIDPSFRTIVSRNLSDGKVHEDGTITGGWNGWLLSDRLLGTIKIEEVIQ